MSALPDGLTADHLTTVSTLVSRFDEFAGHVQQADPTRQSEAIRDVQDISAAFRLWLIETANDGDLDIDLRQRMRATCKLLVTDGDMTPAATQQVMNVFDAYGK